MGESVDSLREYLDYYGFKAEPFVGDIAFFSGGQRQEALEQLEHWSDFGAGINVVEAKLGQGKTRLLRAVESAQKEHAQLSIIEAPVLAGLDQVLLLLAAELGVELLEGQTSGAMLSHLRQHVQLKSRQPSLILVDNADQLDDRIIVALMSLLQGKQAGSKGLNIILFATPGLVARMDRFDVVDVSVNRLQLQSFNESDVSAYLLHQLHEAQYEGPELFSPAEIKEIARVSAGVPAEINILAQNLLVNRLYNKPKRRAILPLRHISLAASLVAVLILAALYQDAIFDGGSFSVDPEAALLATSESSKIEASIALEDSASQKNVGDSLAGSVDGVASTNEEAWLDVDDGVANEESGNSGLATRAADAFSDVGITSPIKEMASSNDGRSTDAALISELAELQNLSDTVASQASEDITDARLSAIDGGTANDIAVSFVIKNEPDVLVGPAGAEAQPIALSGTNEDIDGLVDYSNIAPEALATMGIDPGYDLSAFTFDEQFLLRLPDSAYVLQLMAVRTQEQVDKYLVRQTNRDKLRVFNRERKGKTWYVVIYPYFDTWEEVEQGSSLLTAGQQKTGAWTRSLRIIKADIRSFRGI